ncbi:hydantoinase B/oxoprolinase family protein [Sphingobium phenoxybenzoativorans]|uniref:Hydantoinase B/oxoprolinase family protein n=1 Tax=Sphingobium phenoxybenzoativorans TaxID=1592790 RepID=A0A975Q2U1_9SPHN|nr:hydantoinase B/oxoprolinase family protein [Sphingobium phenoxybenzoativorans]QUT06793.1 hydantoinase B/oxoprolinase family protein [Sphingobium phenoxybenzoativorans]
MGGWQFWVDRGGTFTDIVARAPSGDLRTIKLLSENPAHYRDAAVAGIRQLLDLAPDAPLPSHLIDRVKMGSTVATNSLLERKGAKTLLLIDRGFADVLRIGNQARPDLFALDIHRPEPLYAAVEEIGGRVSVDGETRTPLDENDLLARLHEYRTQGFEACAIALMHAWKHPHAERRVAELVHQAGFPWVSTSHEASPSIGLVARAHTAVVDAYLSPILRRYVDQVVSELGDTRLYFMQSSGGLTDAALFRGKDAILSGPAGGVVGAARTAEAIGIDRIIGFDMGGTSTDVALYAGRFEREFDTEIAGAPVRVPTMAIHTVAAGGGSILHFDGVRFRVGPDSAGAQPGPAAYRNGGPLTVTDANIMLGKVQPARFPHIFGPNANQPLDAEVVQTKFEEFAQEVSRTSGDNWTATRVAEGFVRVAVESMAQAIKRISLEKGHDVRQFALQCFGGAGGQHACLIAETLGMERILIHPFAGVLSAYGMGLADQSLITQQAIERNLDDATVRDVEQLLTSAERQSAAELLAREPEPVDILFHRQAELRYAGTDTALSVAFGNAGAMRAAFEQAHAQRFGFHTPDRALILESVTLEAIVPGEPAKPLTEAPAAAPFEGEDAQITLWSGEEAHAATVHRRESLARGTRIIGPALICDALSTTVIEPGWQAEVSTGGVLLLERQAQAETADAANGATFKKADPVLLELFNNRYMAVAEQMGVVLQHTSTSVNIKERLDYSCAVFDAQGNLIANAPHVPVHLGAMGDSVRTVLRLRGDTLKPGDMIVLNNPFSGGTHLPDVTVVAPVFDDSGRELRFFVGNRAHHTDIGGTTPGSTPPDSASLEEEGVVIDNFLILDGGQFQEHAFRDLLADAPWPARNPDINVADIRAQIAANETGVRELQAMVREQGWPLVLAYMGHVMIHAEESIRRVFAKLKDGEFAYPMDDGGMLRVAVRIDHGAREATIDFSGTTAQHGGNFNAPPAIVHAVVLYVFRCFVDDAIPLNEGCFTPLRIILPEGSFLSPRPGSAVVAGNTEVSQAICNALLGALGTVASSQGTMNNFLFGNDQYQYYETIGGGSGAGDAFDGASAVHTHMTNTRLTDPEVLELRYPVWVEQTAIRRHSGGDGRHRGGDGMIRALRFLEPMTATLVSSRRQVAPFGMAGGTDGMPGRQWVMRAGGQQEDVAGCGSIDIGAGDLVVIETPGGGGFGAN